MSETHKKHYCTAQKGLVCPIPLPNYGIVLFDPVSWSITNPKSEEHVSVSHNRPNFCLPKVPKTAKKST